MPMQGSRIDLRELTTEIYKKVGDDKYRRYWFDLNRFLSNKLSKSDLDKSCYRCLGKENIRLHNRLIRSVVKNVHQAKSPPIYLSKPLIQASGEQKRGGDLTSNHNQNVSVRSNGVLPISPRGNKLSGVRDGNLRDRPSPLRPNGMVNSSRQQKQQPTAATVYTENGELIPHDHQVHTENGDLIPRDHHVHQVHTENGDLIPHAHQVRTENGDLIPHAHQVHTENGDLIPHAHQVHTENGHLIPYAHQVRNENKRQSSTATHITNQVIDIDKDDGNEETKRASRLLGTPITAPLGIPFCPASVGGGSHKATYPTDVSFWDSGTLSDTATLKKRMDRITAAQGLGEVSMECANTMNKMLDIYLKKLIKSSVHQSQVGFTEKQQESQNKVLNGMWPCNKRRRFVEETKQQRSISLRDFKVAMELNPQQLGGDSPLLLEKILMHPSGSS